MSSLVLAIAAAAAAVLVLVLGPWLTVILRSEKQICFENTALIVLGSNQIRSRLADIRQQLESKSTSNEAYQATDGINLGLIPGSQAQAELLSQAETIILLLLKEADSYVNFAVPMLATALSVSETKYLLMRSVEALKQVSKARSVLRRLEQDLSLEAEEETATFW